MTFSKIGPCLALCLLLSLRTMAQDPHFSQFYASPMLFNPAMTGMMPGENDTRIAAYYRNQWGSITVPFETLAAAADWKLNTCIGGGNFFGVGAYVLNDQAGDSDFRNTQAQLAGAFNMYLGDGHRMSAGLQLGAIQQSLNYNSLVFDNQFNGINFDPGNASGEILERNQFTIFDFSAGFAIYQAKARHGYYIGLSAAHLIPQNVSFLGDDGQVLKTRLSLQGGFNLNFSDGRWSLINRTMLLSQGTYNEFITGLFARVAFGENNFGWESAMHIGSLWRANDAFIPVLRFEVGPWAVGLSYDFNYSDLVAASQARGGAELTLGYTGQLLGKSRCGVPVECPQF